MVNVSEKFDFLTLRQNGPLLHGDRPLLETRMIRKGNK